LCGKGLTGGFKAFLFTINNPKNHGYHHDHNFGHGRKNQAEALFLLNLLTFFFHQIFELINVLYKVACAEFYARIEFWNTI
jgi:hypothetical protein